MLGVCCTWVMQSLGMEGCTCLGMSVVWGSVLVVVGVGGIAVLFWVANRVVGSSLVAI